MKDEERTYHDPVGIDFDDPIAEAIMTWFIEQADDEEILLYLTASHGFDSQSYLITLADIDYEEHENDRY